MYEFVSNMNMWLMEVQGNEQRRYWMFRKNKEVIYKLSKDFLVNYGLRGSV